MTQQMPGDAANVFVRVILSDAGTLLGGFAETEWQKTLEWFDGRCAYTGQVLGDGAERDHAIPLNRTHCGLHLFGNVVPATREANRRKVGDHYRQFLQDHNRLERIDAFLLASKYWERVSTLGNLSQYCEAQYRAIDTLCRVNRQYLSSLLPTSQADKDTPRSDGDIGLRACPTERAGVLPIRLDPEPKAVFEKTLLRERQAWITEIYQDGSQKVRHWRADNMAPTSDVIGNVRSRRQYRKGLWEPSGITSLIVSIRRPPTPSGVAARPSREVPRKGTGTPVAT